MKPFRIMSRPVASAIIGLTLVFSSHAAESAPPMTANDLASRLSEFRQNGASYVRLRMEIKGATTETLQVQNKERRTKSSSEVVYQVLYPKKRKGESVLLRKIGNSPASRSLFVPPAGDRRHRGSGRSELLDPRIETGQRRTLELWERAELDRRKAPCPTP